MPASVSTTTQQPNNAGWALAGALGGTALNAIMPGLGSVLGGVMGGGQGVSLNAGAGPNIGGTGGQAIAGGQFSDERVKTDMTKVGEMDDGLPLYAFRYVTGVDPTRAWRVGLKAQDVEKVYPEAVGNDNGIKTVDYGKATWAASVIGDLKAAA
jgi:Chaperone of endosialidase